MVVSALARPQTMVPSSRTVRRQVAGLLVLWLLAFLFIYFTFRPPQLPLWQDPVTGLYGIPIP